ncbi:AAA family ATPase [Allonocardiopsis opalescens]|uniref:Putative ATPase n=1 Tax=Allonocardiopsis opalescens TaxID=1144618 RepID=A0A2T0QDZ2_9ACTN|nr:ATP-binding protein [Allonocardiopsis opalescens]PRY02128.1 putative ATPase [Allonocardiopsis opalescens]
MITRIEIDGFKSFLDFTLDVPPFLALVGSNAGGKSNLFDALGCLADLQTVELDAVLAARRGRPRELFHWDSERRPVEEFTIKADVLVDSRVDGVWQRSPAFVQGIIGLNVTNQADSISLIGMEPESGWSPSSTWRWCTPEPMEMRKAAPAADRYALRENGSNLAAVLGRMRDSQAFKDLVVDLVALVPGVTGVEPVLDERDQEWSFDVVFSGQGAIPATLVSDGTLRIIALLAALYDPDHPGVLLIEEIENGLHPGRIAELLRRIARRVTDLSDPASAEEPLRQVVLTSHSPVVVGELVRERPGSVVFLDTVTRVQPGGPTSRITRARPVRDAGEPGTYVSPREVSRYLGTVRQDAQ